MYAGWSDFNFILRQLHIIPLFPFKNWNKNNPEQSYHVIHMSENSAAISLKLDGHNEHFMINQKLFVRKHIRFHSIKLSYELSYYHW